MQAAAFETSNVREEQELFKGLAGLGGIEEQDEGEEYPMPDVDDFLEDDLLDDDMALWGDQVSPDVEIQGDEGFADDELNIPQYDGGGDNLRESSERKRSAADEWKRANSALHRKRARSSDISANKPPSSSSTILHAPSHSKRLGRSVSSRKLDFRLDSTLIRTEGAAPRVELSHPRREFMECVEIPPLLKRKRSAKVASLLKSQLSEDPIIEVDDDFGAVITPIRSPLAPITAGQGAEIEEISQYSDEETPHETTRTTKSPSPVHVKFNYNYPEPSSPERQYFLNNMDEMWSSPSPPLLRPAFLYSPPHPSSPDLVPAHYPSDDRSKERRTSVRSGSSAASSDHGSIAIERRGSIVAGRTVEVASLANDSLNLDAQIDEDGYRDGPGEVSIVIAAEDSMVIESNQYTPEQEAPQNRPRPISDLPSNSQEPSRSRSNLESLSTPHSAEGSQCCSVFKFHYPAPTTRDLLSSLELEGLPNFVHQKPYFSAEGDVPSKVKVFGGKEFRVQSKSIKTMGTFNSVFDRKRLTMPGRGFRFWEPITRPPSQAAIAMWLKEDKERIQASLRSKAKLSTQKKKEMISQIEGPTQKNPFGYKNSPTKVAGSVTIEKDYIDILSLELHCKTRGSLLPDPKQDPIVAVFYCWQTERESLNSNGWVPGYREREFKTRQILLYICANTSVLCRYS